MPAPLVLLAFPGACSLFDSYMGLAHHLQIDGQICHVLLLPHTYVLLRKAIRRYIRRLPLRGVALVVKRGLKPGAPARRDLPAVLETACARSKLSRMEWVLNTTRCLMVLI